MMKNLISMCGNFKKFHPCRVLDILHFKSDGDMVPYMGNRKNRMERTLVIINYINNYNVTFINKINLLYYHLTYPIFHLFY